MWKDMCGVYYEKVYLTKEGRSEPSTAMQLGHFFEFEATGMEPAHGDPVPEPERLSRASTTEKYGTRPKGSLKEKWYIAKKQAQTFKYFCRKMGIRIDQCGTYIEKDGMQGTLDVQATWVNAPKEIVEKLMVYYPHIDPEAFEIIIDLKFSGLLENKWDELGWDEDAIASKPSHTIQALHYSVLDPGKPFFFWVFSTTEIWQNEMFWMNIDPDSLEAYKLEVSQVTREQIKINYNRGGFTPRPSYNKCRECPLFDDCEYRHSTPIPIQIDYTHGS